MNISQRSLGFSLILHGSLVVIGTLWLLLTSRQSGAAVVTTPEKTLQITPVRLAEKPEPPAPKPAARPGRRPQRRPSEPRKRAPVVPRSTAAPAAVRSSPPPEPSSPPRARPLPSTAARPLLQKPDYPVASSRSPSTRPAASPSPASRPGKAERETAPLWSPEPPETPPPSGGSPGQGDSAGIVVEARPVGRVKLQTPGFLKLTRAKVVARFEIAKDGKVTRVSLDLGTGIPRVDEEILAFLRMVAWLPRTVGGVAVDDVQLLTFGRRE